MPNHLARPQALVARRAALFLAGLFATAIAAQRADAELLYVTTGPGNAVVTYDISLGSAVAVQASGATFVSLSGDANGITIDSANNVYVLEVVNPLNNTTLKKFNQSGTLLTSFAATDGTPNLYADEGLAVRPNGNILGVDQGGAVLEFNSTGTPVRTFGVGNLSTPVGIALDGSGNSYVANAGGTTISKFAADGTFTSNLVTTNLSGPEGVAIRGGSLYVTNAGDSTVSVFNLLDGSFQQSITGNMSFPLGIAFDSAGNFYVANSDSTISKFNSSGVHQFSWTHAAGGTPQFLAIAQVPEPTAMGLAVSGLVCGGYMLRRRRAAHSQARQRAA